MSLGDSTFSSSPEKPSPYRWTASDHGEDCAHCGRKTWRVWLQSDGSYLPLCRKDCPIPAARPEAVSRRKATGRLRRR